MLSIDKNGYCIFHSEDIEWKRRNNFGYWMQILFKFLSLIDKGAIDYEHNGWKGFDLRGIGWLASYGEGEEPVILFDRLNFLSDMYLFFQGGIFYDSVRIRNCKPPETEKLSVLFGRGYNSSQTLCICLCNENRVEKAFSIRNCLEGIHTAGSASGCVREKQDYRSRVVAKGGGDGSCIRTFDFSVGND